jgi:hypothetical protein
VSGNTKTLMTETELFSERMVDLNHLCLTAPCAGGVRWERRPRLTSCVNVRLWPSRRHAYLGSFFLEPADIKNLNMGAIWNYSKAAGLPRFDMGHKGPV